MYNKILFTTFHWVNQKDEEGKSYLCIQWTKDIIDMQTMPSVPTRTGAAEPHGPAAKERKLVCPWALSYQAVRHPCTHALFHVTHYEKLMHLTKHFCSWQFSTPGNAKRPGMNRGKKLCVIQKTCLALGAHTMYEMLDSFSRTAVGASNRFSPRSSGRVESECTPQLGRRILVTRQWHHNSRKSPGTVRNIRPGH